MEIECIFFDLDAVLYIPADFLDVTLELTVKAMIQHGLRATPREALQALMEIRKGDSNGKDHLDQLCMRLNGHADSVVIAAGVEKYWDCKMGNMMPAQGAHKVLTSLASRYPLAVISNGDPKKQAGKLIRLTLDHYFATYGKGMILERHNVYSTLGAKKKPHPHLWQKAAKEIGCRLENSVMVGDRYVVDLMGAKRLGMTTIKVNQGKYKEETPEESYEDKREELAELFPDMTRKEALDLMQPDHVTRKLSRIPELIERIERS